jgi:O-antigen ligase
MPAMREREILPAGFSLTLKDGAALNVRPTTNLQVKPVWLLLLVYPLIFLAVRGSFSFDYMVINNANSGNYGELITVDAGSGSIKHSLELLAAYGSAALAMFMMLPRMLPALTENWIVFILPFYAVLTVTWSQEPKRTLAFSLLAVLNTAFGVYLARCLAPRQQIKLFVAVGVILAAVSLLLVVALPKAGVDYKNAAIGWQGVFPHKNICALVILSFLLAILAAPFQGTFAGLRRALAALMILALLVGTTSRTGWIVGMVTIVGFYVIRFLRKARHIERLLLVVFLGTVSVAGAWSVFQFGDEILHLLGKSSDLSGRTVIWRVIIEYLVNHPWFGAGYDAFWLGLRGDSGTLALQASDPGLNNAENGILQLWLEVGIFGVIFLFAMMIRACKNAAACLRSDTPNYVLWYMAILLLTLLALVDGDKFMYPNAIEWTMFIMADAGLAYEARRIRTQWADSSSSLHLPEPNRLLQTS